MKIVKLFVVVFILFLCSLLYLQAIYNCSDRINWIFKIFGEIGGNGSSYPQGDMSVIDSGSARPGDTWTSLLSQETFRFLSENSSVALDIRTNRQGITNDGPYPLVLGIMNIPQHRLGEPGLEGLDYFMIRSGQGDGNILKFETSNGYSQNLRRFDSTSWHNYKFIFSRGILKFYIDEENAGTFNLSDLGFPNKDYRIWIGSIGRKQGPINNKVFFKNIRINLD